MANPYRSSQGLNSRLLTNSDEIQVTIDPAHAEIEEEITGLGKQATLLKNIAQEIETETKLQSDILSDLLVMSKAEIGVRNGMRRLNRTVTQKSSNHILEVVIFRLVCFAIVYLWSKQFKRQ